MFNLNIIQFSLNLCLLFSMWHSEVAIVCKSTLAHATAVNCTRGQGVVVLAPAERLRGREHGRLLLLVVVTQLAVLAPARLVLALLAILAAVGGLVFHLIDVVKATSVVLLVLLKLSGGSDYVVPLKVVDVAVL